MKNFFVLLLVLSFGKLAVAGVDISGEYRFQEWSNKVEDSGSTHNNRFILGATFREGDSLMAHVSLNTAATTDLVHEAYGVWNFADAFELKFGHFTMNWANGSVFSANDWEVNPYTTDGVTLAYDAGMVKVTYAEIDREADAEAKIQAVSVDFMSLPAVAKTAHVFYVKRDTLTKYGAVVSGDVEIINYDLTYVSDKDGDTSASMIHAKAGVDVLGMGQVLFTYHKDEADYMALAYDRHSNAGLMDVNTWGGSNGLTYYTVGFVHSLNDVSAVGVMYHDFKATDSGDKLGTEIDAYASHKYNDVLTTTARYGKYSPESEDAYSQWVLEVSLNF